MVDQEKMVEMVDLVLLDLLVIGMIKYLEIGMQQVDLEVEMELMVLMDLMVLMKKGELMVRVF